jgi:hypothetical protein
MDTLLDVTPAWRWFPESAEYKDGELRLVLVEGVVSPKTVQLEVTRGSVLKDLHPLEIPFDARTVLVHFTDVKVLHVLGEAAYRELPGELREKGVVAKHENSALLKFVAEFTLVNETTPGKLFHYSVATADDYYHVITRAHPQVSEIEA